MKKQKILILCIAGLCVVLFTYFFFTNMHTQEFEEPYATSSISNSFQNQEGEEVYKLELKIIYSKPIEDKTEFAQEIFELTRLSKTETPDNLIKLLQEEPQDNFDAINQMLIAMEKENQELQQRIIEDNQQYELEKQNLQNRINEQAEEITKMQTEISNILTSKSWKVTKPLRDIKRVIKK